MGKQERRAYLEAIRTRYRRASKLGKSVILDEFCAVCSYHRKYALRLLSSKHKRGKNMTRKSSPASRYDTPELVETLRTIWMHLTSCAANGSRRHCRYGCRTTRRVFIHCQRIHSPCWTPYLRPPLTACSSQFAPRPSARVCPAPSRARCSRSIPIQAGVWNVTQPGFIEADTVAHCGDSLAGDFVWSLTMADICTGWTECRATWNKGADGVMTQIKAIQKVLPFQVKGFDCDNGSEFLNWHLLRYFQSHKQPVKFTRSRPYHSYDNAHVEQKNWSCVRQLFGYDRLGDPKMVKLMNDLYANGFSLFTNFFCPTLKLASKPREGSKWVRKHSKPVTPAQRLLEHPDIPQDAKEKISTQIKTLAPFLIQKQIQRKLKVIFKLLR